MWIKFSRISILGGAHSSTAPRQTQPIIGSLIQSKKFVIEFFIAVIKISLIDVSILREEKQYWNPKYLFEIKTSNARKLN